MAEELSKIARDPTEEDAVTSIDRLESMQRRKPLARDVAQGAAVGAITAPIIGNIKDTIGKGRDNFKKGWGRRTAGQAVAGALAGSAVPLIRSHLARKAEEENVKQYLGVTKSEGARGALRRTMGIG